MTQFSSFLKKLLLIIAFFCVSKNAMYSQCVEIESLLVSACTQIPNSEGLNEMVRFKVGPTALNSNNLFVSWPGNNTWDGVIQNSTTAAKVATLNADIVVAGGCGILIEPVGGILPANASVILVTSYLFDTAANSFGALSENTYIIFHNSTQTAGNLTNYGTTGTLIRTVSMNFGAGCSDTVSYNKTLLSNNLGDSVSFTPAGVPTYYNNGCTAPVDPFTVDAGPVSMTTCAGAVLNFTGNAQGQQSVQWSATQGTFSSPNTLATSFTVPITAVGTIAVVLSATNSCGTVITDTITLLVNASTTPTFSINSVLCNGQAAPALPSQSNNGINGTWSPSTVSSTTSGSYVFTPNAGQCASTYTLNVTVANGNITPTFTAVNSICQGDSLAPLPTTSNNGITGSWSPALNNMSTTTYTFTPNPGQCATSTILSIPVSPNVVPTFTAVSPICSGGTLNPLPTTSNNNILGTWSPALDNTTTTTYTFTPNAGQCAATTTLSITVNPPVTPTFNAVSPICSGQTLAALPTNSTNGISGTWSPALNNTATTTYTFTPNPGQCATNTTLTITVNSNITPTFSAVNAICQGENLSPLPTTSGNGITGTWSPTLNNMATTTYTFTPNAGQCATTTTLTITVNSSITPTFSAVNAICQGETLAPLLTTSTNGISGTWSPALNNTATTTYTFTPNPGQCATNTTLTITVNSSITPTFTSVTPICSGETLAPLPTTSTNGISGTWSPALNNTTTTTYTFTPNAGVCATTTNLTITVNPNVSPTFNNVNPICEGENLAPLPTTSTNGITGTWSPALDNMTTTTYTFTPNAGECATTTTLTIIVNNPGTVTPIIGDTKVCLGSTLQLTNATVGGVWTTINPDVATVDNNGLVTPIISGFVRIVYTIGSSNCNSSFIDIIVNSLPNPLLTDRYICLDKITGNYLSPVNMQCGVENTNHTFEWTLNGQPLPTTTNLHVATEEGLYTVYVTNNTTGCVGEASANVIKSSIAIAEASVDKDFDGNQTITVTVTGGSGDYEYQLDENWPQDSNQFIVEQGEYTITVIDKNGCGTETLSIFALNYPRYFTPNNDGYNDTWFIEGLSNQQEAQIFILDRYGKLIKAIKPYLNEFWDGTLNGHELPSTDYWFTLKYRNKFGELKDFRSHFSLKR